MRNLRYALLPAFLLGSVAAMGQDINEAYNLSNLTVQGTARSMGFGNALGSVGGDFSSVSVNPAGLGIYRSSEFSFTPSLRINSASSSYIGNTTGDNNTHFNINSFGLVFTNAPKGRRYERSNWKAVSFAIGMNRVADFNQSYTYQGVNTTSSASQGFESDANLNPGNVQTSSANYSNTPNSLGYLGYNSYLLNQNAAGQYYSIVPFSGGVNQLKSVQTNGGIDEYTISLGGNYKERLMLGVTIGIPVVNYNSNSSYTESLPASNTAANTYGFSSFNYNQSLNISGSGINAKIGAIYKITDNFRVGAAFHSPTYYSINDNFTPGISTTHNDTTAIFSAYQGNVLGNQFNYNFTTPWKGVLSATFILKDLGFITADYEYVDYNTMRYEYGAGLDNNTGLSYQSEQDAMNQQIKNTYQAASNIRLGAEIKLSKYFMVRAGGGYYGNPYKNIGYNAQRIDLNAGLGFRFRHFFTDLGFVHSMYETQQQPYSVDYSGVISGPQTTIPTAKIDYSLNNLALTVGVKF
jgi:hypothetical protein